MPWTYLIHIKWRRQEHVVQRCSEELERGRRSELGHHVAARVHSHEGDVPFVVLHVAAELRAERGAREQLAPVGRLLFPELAGHRRGVEEPRPPLTTFCDGQIEKFDAGLGAAVLQQQRKETMGE